MLQEAKWNAALLTAFASYLAFSAATHASAQQLAECVPPHRLDHASSASHSVDATDEHSKWLHIPESVWSQG